MVGPPLESSLPPMHVLNRNRYYWIWSGSARGGKEGGVLFEEMRKM